MQNNEPSNQSMPLSALSKAVIKKLVAMLPHIQVEGASSSRSSVSIRHFEEHNEASSSMDHAQLECKVCSKKKRLTTTEGGFSEGPSQKITVQVQSLQSSLMRCWLL